MYFIKTLLPQCNAHCLIYLSLVLNQLIQQSIVELWRLLKDMEDNDAKDFCMWGGAHQAGALFRNAECVLATSPNQNQESLRVVPLIHCDIV